MTETWILSSNAFINVTKLRHTDDICL